MKLLVARTNSVFVIDFVVGSLLVISFGCARACNISIIVPSLTFSTTPGRCCDKKILITGPSGSNDLIARTRAFQIAGEVRAHANCSTLKKRREF